VSVYFSAARSCSSDPPRPSPPAFHLITPLLLKRRSPAAALIVAPSRPRGHSVRSSVCGLAEKRHLFAKARHRGCCCVAAYPRALFCSSSPLPPSPPSEKATTREGSTALVSAGLPTISLGVIFQKMHIVVQKNARSKPFFSARFSSMRACKSAVSSCNEKRLRERCL